jgi:hypothetical protein
MSQSYDIDDAAAKYLRSLYTDLKIRLLMSDLSGDIKRKKV